MALFWHLGCFQLVRVSMPYFLPITTTHRDLTCPEIGILVAQTIFEHSILPIRNDFILFSTLSELRECVASYLCRFFRIQSETSGLSFWKSGNWGSRIVA